MAISFADYGFDWSPGFAIAENDCRADCDFRMLNTWPSAGWGRNTRQSRAYFAPLLPLQLADDIRGGDLVIFRQHQRLREDDRQAVIAFKGQHHLTGLGEAAGDDAKVAIARGQTMTAEPEQNLDDFGSGKAFIPKCHIEICRFRPVGHKKFPEQWLRRIIQGKMDKFGLFLILETALPNCLCGIAKLFVSAEASRGAACSSHRRCLA